MHAVPPAEAAVVTVAGATAQLARQSAAVLPVSTQLTAGAATALVRVTLVEARPTGAAPSTVRAAGVTAVTAVVMAAVLAAEAQTVKETTTDPCEASYRHRKSAAARRWWTNTRRGSGESRAR